MPHKTKHDSKLSQSQSERFKALAKESEADQDEAAFKKRLEKIAKPPQPAPRKKG